MVNENKTCHVKSAEDYESVCQRLDELSLELLVTMNDYINSKLMIEDCMKSGTIHLAKARYIMGNKCVSALQLPTEDSPEILAQTKVQQTASSVDLSFEINRLSLSENCTVDGNLRRSGKSGDKGKETREQPPGSPESNIPRTMSRDPLKWFGVLVPQDLRSAQSKFSCGVDKVVQCANLQLYLIKIQQEYKELLLLKDNFKK